MLKLSKIRSVVLISTWIFVLAQGAPKKPKMTMGAQMTASMPESEKSMLAQKFHALCLMRPTATATKTTAGSGDEWSVAVQNHILHQINRPTDTFEDRVMKKLLVEKIVGGAISSCQIQMPERSAPITSKNGIGVAKQPKQEDNEDIYEGLNKILTNVFSGNLFGVIESSVGIRSPDQLSTTVGDVLRTLLTNIGGAQGAINSGTNNEGAKAAAGAITGAASGGTVGTSAADTEESDTGDKDKDEDKES